MNLQFYLSFSQEIQPPLARHSEHLKLEAIQGTLTSSTMIYDQFLNFQKSKFSTTNFNGYSSNHTHSIEFAIEENGELKIPRSLQM